MRGLKWILAVLAGATMAASSAGVLETAQAQERTGEPTARDILDALVAKGVLTSDEADGIAAEARRRAQASEDVIRVPHVSEATRRAIREEVKQDVLTTAKAEGWAAPNALPEWANRIDVTADVRVRGEMKRFADDNFPFLTDVSEVNANGEYRQFQNGAFFGVNNPPLVDTRSDRYRTRVRARLGVSAELSKHFSAQLRLSTGNLGDPVATSETLSGEFDRINSGFDQAFVRWRPSPESAAFGKSEVVFGKFENPFVSSEILFDRDLQFDGVAGTLRYGRDTDGSLAPFAFLTLGGFPLEEVDFGQDKKFFAAQFGGGARIKDRGLAQAAVALYTFENVQGVVNPAGTRLNDYTAPEFYQFGNSVLNLRNEVTVVSGVPTNTVLFGLASEFELLSVDLGFSLPINEAMSASLGGAYIQNLAFDANDPRAPGESLGDTAWHAKLAIGHDDIDDLGAWRVSAGYRYVEADAVYSAFADSDFGLGGSGQEGFVLNGSLGLSKRVSLDLNVLSSRTIDQFQATATADPAEIDIDTFQIDLSARF